jgi:hypothetical protein
VTVGVTDENIVSGLFLNKSTTFWLSINTTSQGFLHNIFRFLFDGKFVTWLRRILKSKLLHSEAPDEYSWVITSLKSLVQETFSNANLWIQKRYLIY